MVIEFEALLRAVAELPVSQFVRSSVWAYPALETLHLIGLGLLFGPIIIFDLRMLGLGRTSGSENLADVLLPWVWIGFVINAVSGLLLFGSDAVEFGANPAFQVKLALILVAGLNAVVFQVRARDRAPSSAPPSPGLKVQAAASILLWLCVIVAGRLIAYVG